MHDSYMTEQEHPDYVLAENAPVGVQLWPSRAPEVSAHFTLSQVAVIRDRHGERVEWTYEDGRVNAFRVGEKIAVEIP